VVAGKAYSSGKTRRMLAVRGIKIVNPQKSDEISARKRRAIAAVVHPVSTRFLRWPQHRRAAVRPGQTVARDWGPLRQARHRMPSRCRPLRVIAWLRK